MATNTMQAFLTVPEAADVLGLGQHRVREFIRTNRLAAQRRGAFYLIPRKSLDAFRRQKRKVGRPKKF